MSNITPQQIAEIVAASFEIPVDAYSKNHEAAAIVGFLTVKHTPHSARYVCRMLGLDPRGRYLTRYNMAIRALPARLEVNEWLAAQIEAIEAQIDAHHEAQSDIADEMARNLKEKYRTIKTKPLRPINERPITSDWWRENDERFRAAMMALRD